MKTRTISLAIVAVAFLVNSYSFAGNSSRLNREFEVTPVETINMSQSIEKVWTINYSQLDKPVTITLHKGATGKEYIVHTKYMEVVYASDKEGFGIRKIHPSMNEISEKMDSSILNKEQMKNQQILTQNPVSDAYALDLIGSYLPDLLSEQYLHLIY